MKFAKRQSLSALGLLSAWAASGTLQAQGPASSQSATPAQASLPSAAGLMNANLYIYESPTTRRFFDTNLGKYDIILAQWSKFAARQKLTLKPAPPELLRTLGKGAVLILPATVALSEGERNDLEKAAARGLNLFASWAFAPRDEKGTWLGYAFLKKLFATEIVGEIKPDQEERFLQPYAEGPTTLNAGPMKRIYLDKATEPLLRAQASFPSARFSDWIRSVTKDNVNQAAASYWDAGLSRRAWIGFPETTWLTAVNDIDSLLIDTLTWLSNRPMAALANWPAPYQGAFLIEMDTEDKFQNALLFEDELTKRGLRGTFYCLTEQAVLFPDVVKRLAQRHEIGFHADVHSGFKGQDAAAQDARMARMFQQLSPLVPDAKLLTGFRTPLEDFDSTTEALLRRRGIRHHATSPDYGDTALPSFSKAEPGLSNEEALVLLPRTMLDDVNFYRMGLLEKSVAGVLLNSARKVVDSRGFGLLSLHTQNYAAGSGLQRDVPVLLDELVKLKDRVWTTSGDQLEKWWRIRQRLSARVSPRGNNGLDIRLDVRAPGLVEGAYIVAISPFGNQPPRLSGLAGVQIQKLDEQRFALLLPNLKTGTYNLQASF